MRVSYWSSDAPEAEQLKALVSGWRAFIGATFVLECTRRVRTSPSLVYTRVYIAAAMANCEASENPCTSTEEPERTSPAISVRRLDLAVVVDGSLSILFSGLAEKVRPISFLLARVLGG